MRLASQLLYPIGYSCIPSRSSLQSGQDALRRKRCPAQAHAGCIEERVANRGRDRDDRRFASAEGLHFRLVDKKDFDVWDLIEPDDRVAVPVEILLSGCVELNLFHQGPAHPLDDVSLNLVLQPVGIDDQAAVMRQSYFLDGYFTSFLIDLDFGNGSGHGIGPIGSGDSSSCGLRPA